MVRRAGIRRTDDFRFGRGSGLGRESSRSTRVQSAEALVVLRSISFKTPEELKEVFPSLDNFKYRDKWYVLDVGGNNFRVMVFIQFVNSRFYIKHIVNHVDYDRLTKKYRKER